MDIVGLLRALFACGLLKSPSRLGYEQAEMQDEDITTIPESTVPGKPQKRPRAYILRCWREDAKTGDEGAWRFSLEEVAPERRRRGFSSLKKLFDYLKAQLGDEGR